MKGSVNAGTFKFEFIIAVLFFCCRVISKQLSLNPTNFVCSLRLKFQFYVYGYFDSQNTIKIINFV